MMNRRSFVSSLILLSTSVRARASVAHPDLIVIGGGAGGLSAAVCAAENGLKVVLLEKMSFLGGDTLHSGGYFNAVNPEIQNKQGITDNEVLFRNHILKSGEGRNDPKVVETFARETQVSFEWLKKQGLVFEDTVHMIYGGYWTRAHRPMSEAGTGYIRVLSQKAIRLGVDIRLNSKAVSFIRRSDGFVSGVCVEYNGKANLLYSRLGVVVACGGFGAGRNLLEQFAPRFAPLPSDSHVGATGELLIEGQKIGAELVNMDLVECVPGSHPDLKYQVRLDYEPRNMILINEKALRFVNEEGSRQMIATAFLQSGHARCFAVTDQRNIDAFEPLRKKNVYRALHHKYVKRAKTVDLLAESIDVPSEALKQTLSQVRSKKNIQQPPFWAVQIFWRIHTTLGGFRIDENARCLTKEGTPIPGLWATGQAVGNIHGLNRIGGNGINAAVTFGRIAALSAAKSGNRSSVDRL